MSEEEALYCPELSMSLKTLMPALRKKLGLNIGTEGAVIVQIDPDAPPGHEDLKPGMVIYSWGHGVLVSDANVLAQKAGEMVTNPATVRAGGRDQDLLGIWK